MDGYAIRKPTSSTDATPIVITFNNHNLVDNDKITINSHAVNTNANGVWNITKINNNTFSLNGSIATGSGAGGNTGAFAKTVGMANVEDYKTCILTFDTDGDGDAAFTVKVVVSWQNTEPDFAAPKSPSNSYEFNYLVDHENPSADNIPGDTGFVVASTDDNRAFEVNFNGAKWLGVLPTAGTAGELTVGLKRFSETR